MCQMSMFVKSDGEETLLKENVTRLDILEKSIRVNTLFDGPTDLDDLVIRLIDFSAGKVVLEKKEI